MQKESCTKGDEIFIYEKPFLLEDSRYEPHILLFIFLFNIIMSEINKIPGISAIFRAKVGYEIKIRQIR